MEITIRWLSLFIPFVVVSSFSLQFKKTLSVPPNSISSLSQIIILLSGVFWIMYDATLGVYPSLIGSTIVLPMVLFVLIKTINVHNWSFWQKTICVSSIILLHLTVIVFWILAVPLGIIPIDVVTFLKLPAVFAAGTFTSISFFPQLYKTHHSKTTSGLSLGMSLIYCFSSFLWILFYTLHFSYVAIPSTTMDVLLVVWTYIATTTPLLSQFYLISMIFKYRKNPSL